MESFRIPQTALDASRIAYGCMNIGGRWTPGEPTSEERSKAEKALMAAVEGGITMFDHADIYTYGRSEELFGAALAARPGLRDRLIVQSKCGIRRKDEPRTGIPGRYDFSRAHIVGSVEGSLRRLRTDRLDVLLLHRPDALCQPEEVAAAFDDLERSGKVRWFGVSNHTPAQIELLKKFVRQPIVANQVQLSLLHHALISEGILADTDGVAYTASAGTLDYCRLHEISVQAWAPAAGGRLVDPPAETDERTRRTAALVAGMAASKGIPKEAIVLGWLLRHPAGIQPIIGTTNPERIRASCHAVEAALSREEWYALLAASRGTQVP